MYTSLEDEFGDVVGKARQGLELPVAQLALASGLAEEQIVRIERYELIPPRAAVTAIALALGLRPERLQGAAERAFFPRNPAGKPLGSLVVVMLPLCAGPSVNGYLVGCVETGHGVIIDPGNDAEEILRAIEAASLEIDCVLLTHGHHDHTGALSEVCQATGAPALVGKADLTLLGPLATKIEGSVLDGEVIAVGHQSLVARATPGHTDGGICLVHREVAFVGDTLFAGSIGRARSQSDYQRLRRSIEEHLFSLEPGALIMPGHGPASTVGEELTYNPFFG